MLILLPPSEGKTAPALGEPVALSQLSHPELAESRQRVGDALARVSAQKNALAALGAGASLADEVARNTSLWSNPTDVAARVYTGVLYDAAGMSTWNNVQIDRASERVRTISALWGMVSPADHVPAYRLSMGTTLGRLGALAPFWRKHLAKPLTHLAHDSIVVDCRSSDYLAPWRPANPALWVPIRVERELNGRRSVVSHNAKHTRGVFAAHLALADAMPTSRSDVADAAAQLVGTHLLDAHPNPDGITLVVGP